MNITKEDVWDVFWWGVKYGQLLMEEERENEELFDAFLCSAGSRKYALPTTLVRRREVHSEKWFNAMREGYRNFVDYYALLDNTSTGFVHERAKKIGNIHGTPELLEIAE
jgi:hypothetical protein